MSETLTRTELSGTLDELEPKLRSLGFVAVCTMAGPIDLATFDPYGMRRSDSPNIRGVWLNSIFRGCLAYAGDVPYLAGKEPENGSAFVGGLFPLLTAWQVSRIDYLRRCAEGEGGRARLCIDGYGNAATAAYFAREAAHFAGLLLLEGIRP